MTNQEILTKAIDKAIAGGWNAETGDEYQVFARKYDINHKEEVVGRLFIRSISSHSMSSYLHTPEQIIFSHDFAKSIWGEEILLAWGYSPMITVGEPHSTKIFEWQYHLQQMVIADDPIKYLGDNI
jgi:hypothetical protein